ncbi:hypothetical protein BDN72DRAFT_615861 [Pluteus cervinus]|uniref:Uncharacterized protein n=1 Tax=Pluteus cervinus TaxID=181527 RepID=A0ACD3AVF1_9AGAR|nr:hypothetical protein BDN72DRAFT_615861 [Pluteus cervinus]
MLVWYSLQFLFYFFLPFSSDGSVLFLLFCSNFGIMGRWFLMGGALARHGGRQQHWTRHVLYEAPGKCRQRSDAGRLTLYGRFLSNLHPLFPSIAGLLVRLASDLCGRLPGACSTSLVSALGLSIQLSQLLPLLASSRWFLSRVHSRFSSSLPHPAHISSRLLAHGHRLVL